MFNLFNFKILVILTIFSLYGAFLRDSFVTYASIISLATGQATNCVVFSSGKVKCWGNNDRGGLGLGITAKRGNFATSMGTNLTYVDLGLSQSAKQAFLGFLFTCILLETNKVKCFGGNGSGQLGQGHSKDIGTVLDDMGDSLATVRLGNGRFVSQLVVAQNHVCALLQTSSDVVCWGLNDNGQLGKGNTDDVGTSRPHMGSALTSVPFGTGLKPKSLHSSGVADHTCVILNNDGVKCWGYNNYGQLGQGDTNNRGDNPNELGNNLTIIDLGTGDIPVAVYLGGYHTCVLFDSQEVRCWGRGDSGQLGTGTSSNVGDEINEMGSNLVPVNTGSGLSIVSMCLGPNHSCALLSNGKVKCFGLNNHGQLGLGDLYNRGNSSETIGDNLPIVDLGTNLPVTYLTCGRFHTCVLFANEFVKCFGENEDGQLGLGDVNDRGDEPNEMGANLPFINLGPTDSPVSTSSPTIPSLSPAHVTSSPTKSPTLSVTITSPADDKTKLAIAVGILVPFLAISTASVLFLARKPTKKKQKKKLAYITHCKAETDKVAHLLFNDLVVLIDERPDSDLTVFSDIDERTNIEQISKHVEESEVMVGILSKSFFSKPWCLTALYQAVQKDIPILLVHVIGAGFEEDRYERYLNIQRTFEIIDSIDGNAKSVLVKNSINVDHLQKELQSKLPKLTVLPLDLHSENLSNQFVEVEELILKYENRMQKATRRISRANIQQEVAIPAEAVASDSYQDNKKSTDKKKRVSFATKPEKAIVVSATSLELIGTHSSNDRFNNDSSSININNHDYDDDNDPSYDEEKHDDRVGDQHEDGESLAKTRYIPTD